MSATAAAEGDFSHQSRSALRVRGFALLTLSFQTLGIIYSDIGTSPLYVLNGIWPASGPVPSQEDVIGGISAIIWAITLLPLVKYVFICLRFGTTEGEGGTFALFQGLYPPVAQNVDDDRTLTGDSFAKTSSFSSRISPSLRWPLLIWCLFGTSLTFADGIFTPAVSVTSAVGGLAVAKASIANDIIPISIAILVLLFLVQFRGTNAIAFIFAPVTFIWLSLIASTGIVNITTFPGIFRAFDPSRAVMLFVRTRNYDLLAGVLLAITGCEAMFANLGHFNMASIQLSFSCFVYPSLVLAYLGQGSRLIVDKDAVLPNVFYNTIPGKHNGPLFWIVYVFAMLATIIASQALISATFSLAQQLIHMRTLPPLRRRYTSDHQGNVYIPSVNLLLMILTIVVVAAFKSSTALTNAYGFSVATVMFSTTVLIAVQMRYVKQAPVLLAIAFFLVFGFLDGAFWGAALKKVPHGAWVPLMVGVLLTILMAFWSWAKGLEDAFDGDNLKNLRHIITLRKDEDTGVIDADKSLSSPASTEEQEKQEHSHYVLDLKSSPSPSVIDGSQTDQAGSVTTLARIPACAIFHKTTTGKGVPHSFVGFIRQWPALPRIVIFLSIHVLPVARVPLEYRYTVTKVRTLEGFYGVTYYLGFRDSFDMKAENIIDCICASEARADPERAASVVEEIRRIALRPTHIVPHYIVRSKKVEAGRLSFVVNACRRFLIEEIYARLTIMFPGTTNLLGSADEIIHVGITAFI